MTTRVVIRRLTSVTPGLVQRRLMKILEESRSALVRPGEHLESISERITDAESDRQHLLLYARVHETHRVRTAGFLDGRVHYPDPGSVSIGQLSVARAYRRQGIGTMLIEALRSRAARKGSAQQMIAATHSDNDTALNFWLERGFMEQARAGSVIILTRAHWEEAEESWDRRQTSDRHVGPHAKI